MIRRSYPEFERGLAGIVTPEEWRSGAATAAMPDARDIDQPAADRALTTAYRILRDTAVAQRVKQWHRFECQVCGRTLELPGGRRYAEGHHIRPLGSPHNGPDVSANVLCLCPNHHAELDYGVIALSLDMLRSSEHHRIDPRYIEYHNRVIYRRPSSVQLPG